jgi:hypothetical protein
VGVAADASGNLFFETGNGDFNAQNDLGDSVIKVNPSGAIADWFTPYNQAALNAADQDLGSGGAMLLPDQAGTIAHEVLAGGKEGQIYLLNRDQMGHYQATSNSQIVQTVGIGHAVFGSFAYWNGNVYVAGLSDALKAFALTNGRLTTSPTSSTGATFGSPGAPPVVSANGASGGIVWAVEGHTSSPSVLHAFDATNLSHELYNSTQAGTRDALGNGVKFVVPTVANGKVYVGTQSEVTVLGLLP